MSELEHTNNAKNLVTADGRDPVTTTLVIAAGTNSEHRAVLQLVRNHLPRFEEFGRVAFEMRPFETAGGVQRREIAVLNEYQASLLLTFMRNNEIVVDFKVQLIKAFRQMREAIQGEEPSGARELALQTQLLARRAEALASALIASQDALDVEKREHQGTQEYVEMLEPVAESWMDLAEARGTLSVADVSAILNNDHGIDIGEIRLFRFMEQQGWIYRVNGPKSPWRPYQAQITAGRLTERLGGRYYDRSHGEYRMGTPQVRVTQKGLHRLRILLSGGVPIRNLRSQALPPAPDPR